MAPCQYGAPHTGTGFKTGVLCQNGAPSAGTGRPVLELGDYIVTPNGHPPHIGTGASTGHPTLALVPEWDAPIPAMLVYDNWQVQTPNGIGDAAGKVVLEAL